MDGNEVKAIAEGNYLLESCIAFNSVLSELSQNGENIKLAYTESKTLLLLIQHVGEIVSREQITEYSWSGRIVTDSSLAKSISNVRKALRELGLEDDVIITVPRIGYRLICKVIKMEESICQDNIELLASENEFNDLDKKMSNTLKAQWRLPVSVTIINQRNCYGIYQ
ncbi:winged helix-turn-helix domain-containing protein [Aeromonas schubertii]|uniref:winged helix-turn-helix domain-containing protein n=1 Tax=Aeromonas schubertii TaxID=652 RepID=UPI0010A87F30|nr:transcriptional regulator [Aeromonas schubertii]QCG47281.1 transcriptional regulator [Aeromonas schubertii]